MTSPTNIQVSRTAVLCMDFQRDIISDSSLSPAEPEAQKRFSQVVERTREFLTLARGKGLLAIHVRIAFSPGYREASPHVPMSRFMQEQGALIDGEPGADFDPRVAPLPREPVVTKRGVSAFVGTELERLLRTHDIDTLFLCGLVTHYVVEGTARHASDLGFRFIVVDGCCASAAPERHAMSLTNLRPLGTVLGFDDCAASLAAASP